LSVVNSRRSSDLSKISETGDHDPCQMQHP
jgi:hypothetical protein